MGTTVESVWSYPDRPTFVAEHRRIRVEFAGVVVADTTRAVRLIERGLPPSFYIPAQDTRADLLVPEELTTFCPVKGEAHYWSVRVGNKRAPRAAWSYLEPHANAESVRGLFAFDVGQVDRCTVDGATARGTGNPFYAGWVTDEIEGPFVGDPDLPEELLSQLPRPPISETGKDTFEEVATRSFSLGRRYLRQ